MVELQKAVVFLYKCVEERDLHENGIMFFQRHLMLFHEHLAYFFWVKA
jgi:hypothetical protein